MAVLIAEPGPDGASDRRIGADQQMAGSVTAAGPIEIGSVPRFNRSCRTGLRPQHSRQPDSKRRSRISRTISYSTGGAAAAANRATVTLSALRRSRFPDCGNLERTVDFNY